MSDGGRERVSLEVEVRKSSQKVERTAVRRSLHRIDDMVRVAGCGRRTYTRQMMMKHDMKSEIASPEATRRQFNGGPRRSKLGIDVHQHQYVVVAQVEGAVPKPPQRFTPAAFLQWAAKLRRSGDEIQAVYEACGFGFTLQRQLTALGIHCYVVAPQKLDERGRRVKTDGRDAKALCLRLDRYLQGNRDALAVIRIPSEAEEQRRALHRQREQLVRTRTQLEAHGRSLLVNHGLAGASGWWKARTFAQLELPQWLRQLLENTQPLLVALQKQIQELTKELAEAADPIQPRGLGALTSVVLDREIGDWHRFANRRQVGSYTGLCPSEYSTGQTRLQGSITKHGNPRVRAALVEAAWRFVRFQPAYHALARWRLTLSQGAPATGAARKKAIVAVARQLAIDLWRLRTGQTTTEKLGLI
jgi:transposase